MFSIIITIRKYVRILLFTKQEIYADRFSACPLSSERKEQLLRFYITSFSKWGCRDLNSDLHDPNVVVYQVSVQPPQNTDSTDLERIDIKGCGYSPTTSTTSRQMSVTAITPMLGCKLPFSVLSAIETITFP